MRLLVGPAAAVERLLAGAPVDHVLTLISPDTGMPVAGRAARCCGSTTSSRRAPAWSRPRRRTSRRSWR
ncbi:hypothetical protein ACRAWD_00630 [Caulobacter segnis]